MEREPNLKTCICGVRVLKLYDVVGKKICNACCRKEMQRWKEGARLTA